MKTHPTLRIFLILTGALLFAGCEGAQVPLGEPDEMPVDARMMGEWIAEVEDEDEAPTWLRVWAFNDHEYYVEWETEGDEEEMARLRAFSSDLGDFIFSNIQCINCDPEDRDEWFFYQYELESDDVLLIRGIDEEHYNGPLSSMTRSRDVRQYVEQHMGDEGFFSEGVARFTRFAEDEMD